MNEMMMQAACIDKITETILFFRHHLNKPIPMPPVSFNIRPCRKAGVCYDHEIRLSPHYLKQEGEKFINETPAHEAVHWVELKAFGKTSHGSRWKSLMMAAGLNPDPYHHFDTRNFVKRFEYECECMVHLMSLRAHKRIRSGGKYHCTKCRKTLTEVVK